MDVSEEDFVRLSWCDGVSCIPVLFIDCWHEGGQEASPWYQLCCSGVLLHHILHSHRARVHGDHKSHHAVQSAGVCVPRDPVDLLLDGLIDELMLGVQSTVDNNWDFFQQALKGHYNATAGFTQQIAEATDYIKKQMQYVLYVPVAFVSVLQCHDVDDMMVLIVLVIAGLACSA